MDAKNLVRTVLMLALLGLVLVYAQRLAAGITAKAGV